MFVGESDRHARTLRVDLTVPELDQWLATLFDVEHLDHTCEVLSGPSEPDPAEQRRQDSVRTTIAECDRKLARYRSLLDQDSDVTIAAKWIAETQREGRALEAQHGGQIPGEQLTKSQVKPLVTGLRDIIEVLAEAEPADKADFYKELGISLRYNPGGQVSVEAFSRGFTVRVEGRH